MAFRFLRRGAFVALFALALIFGLRVPQSYMAWRAKNVKIRALERENADLKRENEKRRIWIEDLKNNRSAQERVIRERLQKQREGDTTFMLGK